MGDASIMEMYFDALPKIAANVAAPLTNVDGITIYGEGGTTKMIGDVTQSVDSVMKAITDSTGIDMRAVLAGYLGGKVSNIDKK